MAPALGTNEIAAIVGGLCCALVGFGAIVGGIVFIMKKKKEG